MRRTNTAVLRVEPLETRDVPATVTVTTLADTVAVDGAVSLREAILSINAGSNQSDVVATGLNPYGTLDSIRFTGLSGTITLTSDLVAVSNSVVIEGNVTAAAGSNPTVTVDGGLQFKTFVITGPSVTIARLAIVRSSASGIQITGAGATGAIVRENHIGIDAGGTTAASNIGSGIAIDGGATGAVIGGILGQDDNVISGQIPTGGIGGTTGNGISISGAGTSNHTITGNLIGTNAAGTLAVGNRTGISIESNAANNTIGGTDASSRNVISGNTGGGIGISGVGTSGNLIRGNYIGTDVSGLSPLGNRAIGVFVTGSGNTIGGTAAGAGNLIAFNGAQGVWVTSIGGGGAPQGDQVLGNSIFSNGALGIDLGAKGVTANDNLDADTGPNQLQNYPVITSVVANQIFGSLHSNPVTSFRLEFFSSTARDPSGFGEGQTYLGFLDVTTDVNGNAPFTFNAPGAITTFATATATNMTTGTSEFSNAVFGIPTPPITPTLTPVLVPQQVPPAIPQAIPQAVPVLNTPIVASGATPTVTAGNIAPTAGASTALASKAALAVAQGPGGDLVKVFNTDGTLRTQFAAFPGFLGGVRLGTADVNNDGFVDVIAGAGIGAPNGHVKVFSGADGSLLRSFFAFTGFAGGLNVAGGDINADGFAEVIVGTATGSSNVKVFDGQTGELLTSFFAFAPAFAGGVTVAARDFNNDGLADVVVGAGPGAPPHVKVLEATALRNVQANGQIADAAALASFFAFGPAFQGGVFVSAGADFNNDGLSDLVVGAGPGAGPHVKVLNGSLLTQLNADTSISNGAALASLFAFDQAFRGGVRVGEADTNGNGQDEIVIGAGPGADPDVRLLRGTDFTDVRRFDAFDVSFTGGVFVD